MEKLNRYLSIVMGDKDTQETFQEKLEIYVSKVKPYYQIFKVDESPSITFISFISERSLTEIRMGLDKKSKGLTYLLFNINDEGTNFEFSKSDIRKYLLLENLEDKNSIQTIDETTMDLNGLLELVHKNGWGSLSDEQKKKLEDYSNE